MDKSGAKRKPAAGTIDSAVDAVRDVASGYPEPPQSVVLRPSDRPFWDAILHCRLPSEWAKVDLVHAAQLARSMADVETNRALLLTEGDLTVNTKTGVTKVNPRHVVLEVLSKRCMSLTRLLQIHARAVVGKAADLGVQKGEAMAAAQAFEEADDDDLLARPNLQ